MKTKNTLGVLMIVKNEQAHLAACLESVKDWVDEIVIVDSGSTDKTKQIALSYTDKFYSHEEWQGFGKQRQIAQSYMDSEWIIPLDADERVTEELRDSILQAIQSEQPNIAFKINRSSSAFGKFIKHSGWSPEWILRLYRNSETQYNDDLVHEKLVDKHLKLKKLEGVLLHYTYDDIHHYIRKTTGYIKAWSDQREGKKKVGLSTALIHAFSCFFKMYILKMGFLDGKHGFILAWVGTHSTFIKYIDLWLREYKKD